MAMNGTQLGDQIWTAVKAIAGTSPTPAQEAEGKALWEAVGQKIVQHIQSQGEVVAGIPVATSGGPTSQTGATTAPGTIS